MKLKIPPPIYMATAALLMWLLKNYFPIYRWESSLGDYAGIALIVIGGSIDAWSLSSFVRTKTTVNPLLPHKASSLVVEGMYRFTRNPMYLGMLVVLTGWCLYLGALSGLVLIPLFIWVLTVVQIIPEEIALEKIFGEVYLQYKTKVRRWL